VRQEWIAPYKPYLKDQYKAFHGVADLYVYFYELGMRVLRPGGRLSFVVTNKWLKAGYAEPLRRFFSEEAWVESVVDFGHAKQIFEDADVFPSIIVARKPTNTAVPLTTRACSIRREQLRVSDLGVQIAEEGFEIDRGRLGAGAWSLEPKAVVGLLAKLRHRGLPLSGYGVPRPFRGVVTGLNEAFIVDTPTRDALIARDPACQAVIGRHIRGQDLERWSPGWDGLWMIVLKSSGDYAWPWSDAGDRAEEVFSKTYPSLYARMKPLEGGLRNRQDRGRHWWELRACAYWQHFEKPKLVYQDITWKPSFGFDARGTYMNNTVYFLATSDLWVLAVLNSPIGWWFAWREAQHGKDEALRYFTAFLEGFPVPTPSDEQREVCERAVSQLVEQSERHRHVTRGVVDWLKVEFEVDKLSSRLCCPIALDSDAFVNEVKKVRGKKKPLSLAALRSLREEHARTIVPAQAFTVEARELETMVSDLVNGAYGLTPDEVRLVWETAPPRMPVSPPISLS
jgi:hypothetical protein